MPKFRLKNFNTSDPGSAYLCSTYASGGIFFDETDKEMFKIFLHQLAEFSGLKIISYVILPDHLHILAVIPKAGDAITDAEYLRRLKARFPLPTPFAAAQIAALEEIFRTQAPCSDVLRSRLQERVETMSEFMKNFKQQSAIWFNRAHGRRGTLWSMRYSGTIFEAENLSALRLAAAHINLNPVRYQLVDDPKDYRWSTFGEAANGDKNAISGLALPLADVGKPTSPAKVLAAYRDLLYVAPGKQVHEKLSLAARLRKRMPWFSHGGAIGSKNFVEKHRADFFGDSGKAKRRYTSKVYPFSLDNSTDWPDIYTMRTSC